MPLARPAGSTPASGAKMTCKSPSSFETEMRTEERFLAEESGGEFACSAGRTARSRAVGSRKQSCQHRVGALRGFVQAMPADEVVFLFDVVHPSVIIVAEGDEGESAQSAVVCGEGVDLVERCLQRLCRASEALIAGVVGGFL